MAAHGTGMAPGVIRESHGRPSQIVSRSCMSLLTRAGRPCHIVCADDNNHTQYGWKRKGGGGIPRICILRRHASDCSRKKQGTKSLHYTWSQMGSIGLPTTCYSKTPHGSPLPPLFPFPPTARMPPAGDPSIAPCCFHCECRVPTGRPACQGQGRHTAVATSRGGRPASPRPFRDRAATAARGGAASRACR